MKHLRIATIMAALFVAGCLGDEDPGIFGEYTTFNQCKAKEGWSWKEPKYVAWDAMPGCKKD